MTTQILSIIIALMLASCSKTQLPAPRTTVQCDRACLLSFKYRKDKSLINSVADTLWPKRFAGVPFVDTVCGRNLQLVLNEIARGDNWLGKPTCPPIGTTNNGKDTIQYECWRYVLGDTINHAPILK
jgi:hypothetical protein